jgi:hypothetical protein
MAGRTTVITGTRDLFQREATATLCLEYQYSDLRERWERPKAYRARRDSARYEAKYCPELKI